MKALRILSCLLLIILLKPVYADQNDTLNRGFAWPIVVNNLDPHNTSSDTLYSLIAHHLEPLVAIGPDNKVIPALAESWQISADGRVIRLTLRKDAKWSDGTPITAQQVKQSITRALSKGMTSDARPLLLPIKGAAERLLNNEYNVPLGVVIHNTHQLSFHLTRSNPEFLRVLAFPITSPIPTHLISDNNQYPPIGRLSSSGAYQIVSTEKYTAYFQKNPTYHGKPAHYKGVSFKFGSYESLIRGFLMQSLDTLEYIPTEQIPWLEKDLKQNIEIIGSTGAFYLVMKSEMLNGIKPQIRRLMIDALDIQRLNQLMTHGYFPTIHGLIPWEESIAPTKKESTNNDKKAHEIRLNMEALGYNAQKPMEICIYLRPSTASDSLFNFLKSHWLAIHIKLTRKEYSDSDSSALTKVADNNPELLCEAMINGFRSRIKSEEEVIHSFFIGKSFSKLLTVDTKLKEDYQKAISLSDPTLRAITFQKLENQLLRDHSVTALYKSDLISLVNQQKVSNYTESQRNLFIPASQTLKP